MGASHRTLARQHKTNLYCSADDRLLGKSRMLKPIKGLIITEIEKKKLILILCANVGLVPYPLIVSPSLGVL